MPNSNSAKKRLRQSKARKVHNRSIKSAVKTQIKKVNAAVTAGDVATAEQEYVAAARGLDKAGSKNIIHPNAAARSKSRLQKKIRIAKQGS